MTFSSQKLAARLDDATKMHFEKYELAIAEHSLKYADLHGISLLTIGAARIALESSSSCFDYTARRFVNYCAHFDVNPAMHIDILETALSAFIERIIKQNEVGRTAQSAFREGPDHFPETYTEVSKLKERFLSDAAVGEVGVDVIYKHQAAFWRHYDRWIKDVFLVSLTSAIFSSVFTQCSG